MFSVAWVVWYFCFMRLKSSSLLDSLFSLSLIVIGNCFKSELIVFLQKKIRIWFFKCEIFFSSKVNSMSRKTVYISCASTVTLKPHSLNVFLSAFDVVSALLGDLFRMTARSSS